MIAGKKRSGAIILKQPRLTAFSPHKHVTDRKGHAGVFYVLDLAGRFGHLGR